MTFIAEGILHPQSPRPTLLGGRSKETGEIRFPLPTGALAEEFEPVALKREGKLWAYTIQRFPPGHPYIGVTDRAEFKPFAVGYVELDGEVIVETRIVTHDLSSLKINMPMVLTLESLKRGDAEGDVTTYAFQPAAENNE